MFPVPGVFFAFRLSLLFFSWKDSAFVLLFYREKRMGWTPSGLWGFLFFLLLLCCLLFLHWRLISFTKEESKSAWLGGTAGFLPTYLAIVRILIYPSRRPLLIFCWQCRWLYHYYYYYYYYFYHQNLRPCYYLVLSACLGCSVFGGR